MGGLNGEVQCKTGDLIPMKRNGKARDIWVVSATLAAGQKLPMLKEEKAAGNLSLMIALSERNEHELKTMLGLPSSPDSPAPSKKTFSGNLNSVFDVWKETHWSTFGVPFYKHINT